MPSLPHSLSIRLELAEYPLPIRGSASQLLRVLSNLLSNAREAMQDIGCLQIKTNSVNVDKPFGRYNRVEVGEYVRLEVMDNGCGIAEEIKDKVA